MTPKAKWKKCRVCKVDYIAYRTTQIACSPLCALDIAREKEAKKKAQETSKMRREFNAKDKSYQLKKAQEAFNAYIRERDKGQPCISCGNSDNKMTAGHYRTTASQPALRFNELNCHGQCWWNCNKNKSGNIAEYRPNLVKKIGEEKVQWLEKDHDLPNYTLKEVIEIKNTYRKKLKALRERVK